MRVTDAIREIANFRPCRSWSLAFPTCMSDCACNQKAPSRSSVSAHGMLKYTEGISGRRTRMQAALTPVTAMLANWRIDEMQSKERKLTSLPEMSRITRGKGIMLRVRQAWDGPFAHSSSVKCQAIPWRISSGTWKRSQPAAHGHVLSRLVMRFSNGCESNGCAANTRCKYRSCCPVGQ